MPWPSESRCRFVVATDSRIIHATGMRRRQACARAGRGLLACFCGVRIRLPQQPPQRIVPGWHHYCPECLCFLIAASDRPLASPLNTYEPWLCELARLDTRRFPPTSPEATTMLTRVLSRLTAPFRAATGDRHGRTDPGVGPADDPHGGAGMAGDAAPTTAELPRLHQQPDLDRTWFVGRRESRWHASEKFVSPHSHRATGACGHTVHNPHHSHSGYDPPQQPHHAICGPCLHAIDYLPPRPIPSARLRHITTPHPTPHTGPHPAGLIPHPRTAEHHLS